LHFLKVGNVKTYLAASNGNKVAYLSVYVVLWLFVGTLILFSNIKLIDWNQTKFMILT